MAVHFYVEGWREASTVDMPVYAKDEYPNLDVEDFIGPDGKLGLDYHQDAQGNVYRIEKVPANDIIWPKAERSVFNAPADIRLLIDREPDEDDRCSGSLTAEEVEALPEERIPFRLSRLIEFARQRGKGIYWT